MGILNVTPDSFSDGGQFTSPQHARDHAIKMVTEGVDIIDIGGESTRPGAKPVSLKEELKRIKPVIGAIRKESDCLISIDTYKASVAEVALDLGANIVNDISSLSFDQNMAHLVSKNNVPIILMHMQGSPQNMQLNTSYDNLINDLIIFFKSKIKIASQAGISNNMIILDPGIGFGKKFGESKDIFANIEIIKKSFNLPIMIGTSRKSFIGEYTQKEINNRIFGTASTIAFGVLNGANILRVHDYKEMIDVKNMTQVLKDSRYKI